VSDKQGQVLAVARLGRQAGLALAVVLGVALALAALALAPSSAPGVSIADYPLCTEDGTQSDPAAHGDRVVWIDQRADPSGWLGDIWMFDYATGEETQITDDEFEQSDPDLWGDWVVFYDYRNGNGDIYAKNVDTGEEIAVCTNAEPQQRPKVCGDVIVWEDLRGGDWDIYYYRIGTGEEGSFSSGSDRSPDVYQDASGYVVAYEAYQDLYVYNVDTDELRVPLEDIYGATLVAGDDEFVCGRFEEDAGTGEYDLHLYRYSWADDSLVEIPTSYEPYAEFRKIAVSGDKVAYTHDSDSGFKVRVHDWAEGQEVAVTSVESDQSNPAIAGDMVVWQDDRNCDPAASDYLDLYTTRDPAPAPADTSLEIEAAATIVPYKGTTTLTVHLEDAAGAPLSGYLVDIQKSTDWGATWTTIGTAESDGGTFVTPALTRATKFRATWAGAGEYGASTSGYVLVKPMVELGNPDAPTTVQKYVDFLVSGTLQPRHTPGWNEAVKLYCYKKDADTGTWVLKKTVWCKTVDYLGYSKYRVTTYLGSTGSWKLRAFAPEDTLHAASWSTSHYLTVK
jgi:beta propeller repeat protein